MRARERVTATLKGAGTRVPAGLRGRIGRASRRFRGEFSGPLVSIVLPLSDADTTQIGPCLDSLRSQTHRNLEILLAPWGPTTSVLATAAGHTAADWRVRVLDPQSSWASALNHGAGRARGEYLLFMHGGDDLEMGGVGRLVNRLERTSSDFAVGRQAEPERLMAAVTAPLEAAHRDDVNGTTLADSPVAATDLGLGNRMFRATWWRRAGLQFVDGTRHRHDVVLDAYARGTFDLLRDATYIPNDRRDGVVVGATLPVLDALADWASEQSGVSAALERIGVPQAQDLWLWGVLDTAVHPFLDDVERATDEQWATLREQVETLLGRASEAAVASLRAESKVKLWLARTDHRSELAEYVAARWFENGMCATEVRDGRVHAKLPFHDDTALGIPAEHFVMSEAELPMRLVLRGVRTASGSATPAADGSARPGMLQFDLMARIDFVSMATTPEVTAWLVPEDDPDARVALRVEQYADPHANQVDARAQRYQDFSLGAFTAHLDADAAAQLAAHGPGRWVLNASIATQGLSRTGTVTMVDDRGTAGLLGTAQLPPRAVPGTELHVGVEHRPALRVVLSPAPRLTLADARVEGRRLTGVVTGTGPAPLHVLVDGPGNLEAKGKLLTDGPDRWTFSLDVPPGYADPRRARWQVRAVTVSGSEALAWPAPDALWLGAGDGSVTLMRGHDGGTTLVESALTAVVESYDLDAEKVTVRGRWLGPVPDQPQFELTRRDVGVSGTVVVSNTDELVVTFPTSYDPWGLGDGALPFGRYWFEVRTGSGSGKGSEAREGKVWVSESAADTMLDSRWTPEFYHRLIRLGRDAGLFLQIPLADTDRGPYQQRRLQQWFLDTVAEDTLPLEEDLVYLQSYAGASATDSQLALHHELRRSRPDLRIVWGVREASSWTPEGAERVTMYSRRWYEVMATATYLSLNIDTDRWFAKRPGQVLLQTFHGYPSKSMGIRMWEAKGYTPLRIRHELARTRDDWSLILTPSPEMDVHYRTEYAWDGPIHSEGYPRDDLIVNDRESGERRADVRRRLGIAEHQKVVLYAPTWRDDKALNWRKAEAVLHLDIEEASKALGPDYVFLMRGHRFHEPLEERGSAGAKMIDVTSYPEINDLIVASDAAVLDYSSLRFDFSLTRRPMVFLVPDLADYTGGVRGFLYDYRSTAPGPLVSTVTEVVDALRDLPALQREYADAYATHEERFNRFMDGRAAERVARAWLG